jgi:hypothetical protein
MTNRTKRFSQLRNKWRRCPVLILGRHRISVLDEGDMRPDLGVTEHSVIDMNHRLGGNASLNAPIRQDGDAGEQD